MNQDSYLCYVINFYVIFLTFRLSCGSQINKEMCVR